MRQAERLHRQEALGVLSAAGGRLGRALARASFRLRLSTAFERALRWSWANAAVWAAVAFFSRALAPWAVTGCAACFALSGAAFFIFGRVDGFQAARAVDRASRLNELVSTAAECSEGKLASPFCPLIVAEAERTHERGMWRMPRPGLPARARYAAIPAALLVLFALLPARSRGGGGEEGELTAEDVLGISGEGQSLSRPRKRLRRVAAAARAKRLRTALRAGASPKRGGAGRASRGAGGREVSEAEKRPGKPARASGTADAPEAPGSLPEGEGLAAQEKAALAAMIEEFPRYAQVIGRFFGEEER